MNVKVSLGRALPSILFVFLFFFFVQQDDGEMEARGEVKAYAVKFWAGLI